MQQYILSSFVMIFVGVCVTEQDAIPIGTKCTNNSCDIVSIYMHSVSYRKRKVERGGGGGGGEGSLGYFSTKDQVFSPPLEFRNHKAILNIYRDHFQSKIASQ